MIADTLKSIEPLDSRAMEACRLRIDNLTKPLNSLHSFEHIAIKLAGVSGSVRPPKPDLKKTLLLTACNSNSFNLPCAEVLRNFADHVDAGFETFDLSKFDCENNNFTSESIESFISAGICRAKALIGSGTKILGLGVTEFGSDLSQLMNSADSNGWENAETYSALASHSSGLQIAVMAGFVLGAASKKALIVLDGPETALSAYIAACFSPLSKDYLIGSHAPTDADHQKILNLLDLPTYLHLDLANSCGLGALLGMSIINASIHILSDMKTFGEADVAVAQDGPGSMRQDRRIR